MSWEESKERVQIDHLKTFIYEEMERTEKLRDAITEILELVEHTNMLSGADVSAIARKALRQNFDDGENFE